MTWLIIIGAIALPGIPYGYKIYRQKLADGASKQAAITQAVLRGVCWPIEQLVKRSLDMWREMFGSLKP